MDDLRALVRVDNPLPAVEGRDAESLDSIRYRAPAGVSQPLSAVTVDDYVRMLQQMPEVAGASARAVDRDLRTVIRVTVLLRDEDTLDRDELLRRWAGVRSRLEEIRLLGVDVEALPPKWVPLDLDLEVDAAPYAQADQVRGAVVGAIAGDGGLLDPDRSGLNGDVQLADLYQAVLRVPGVTAVRVKRFRRLEPQSQERLEAGVIPIGPDEVATARGGYWPGSEGVLTVQVCGGLR
nr:baseplate J/gp47 family protein [Corallococcus exiguus]